MSRLKEQLRRHINALERVGLPVRFLYYVLQRYDFSVGSSDDQITPLLNLMELRQSTMDDLREIDPWGTVWGTVPGSGGIDSLYHESTHAYFDLKSDEGDQFELNLLREARLYYQRAPMSDGSQSDDPERLAQEAPAEYVGQCAYAYWSTNCSLARYTVREFSGVTAESMESTLRRIQSHYEAKMGEAQHGCYATGSLWWEREICTTKPIFPPLKRYCDSILLENKLSATFSGNTRLSALLAQVRTRMVAAGLTRPGAPARSSGLRAAPDRR
jgi:hypothetical protein